ncbi:restriction endonuclease subunit S [Hoeflea sp.]|uniref:restriction endonuclease subunit S n=1 Tax=Hoeflea sp. TaxID=1940281 RepID=UPI003A8CE1C1
MKVERLLHAFSMIGEDPARIQQLRQVAVALAVAGKLDTGNATLSPRDMMHAVEEVKADLVRRRAIPKPNKLQPVDQVELPEGFPDASRFAPLGSVARVEKGLTGIKQAQPGPFPLVVTGAERASCDHFDFEGAAAIIPLVSSTGHGHASLNRLHYQEGKFALGTILAAVFPFDPKLVSARFIFEYLSAFKEELLVTRMTGTANVTLSIGRISEVPVPLVDPTIQAQVDELMALLDRLEAARTTREATRDRLTAASLTRLTALDTEPADFQANARFALATLPAITTRPDQIKPLRQAILNLAVRGKLVEQDPTDEPASELLKRIAMHLEDQKNGRGRRAKPLPDVDPADAPFELPEGWTWARFPELGEFGRGKSKHRPRNDPALYTGGTHLMIQTGDVARSGGRIKTHTNKYNDVGLAQSMLWPKGTLCITIAANIADSGILDFDACFPDSVVGFVPAPGFENARYFEYFVRTAKANLLEFAPATAQKNINLEILTSVLIPLPPFAEQHRIVAKVDALMALCDRLEAALTTADTTRARLLEALLADALNPASMQEMETAE